MTNGLPMDQTNMIHTTMADILRACAAGTGPFAPRIEARRLLKWAHEVARLIRAAREAVDEHYRLLMALVTEIIARGIRPGDPRLRALLLPIAGRFADLLGVPKHFQSVLKVVCRHQMKRRRGSEQMRSTRKPTPVVAAVAKLLEGRSIVMIGGQRNQTAERKLQDALGLKSVYWIETREHQSLRGIESAIGRPEVAAVALLIKLSSHSFGPQIQKNCRRLGTPLVRLKAGYNANQVAKQILKQCGKRLQAKRSAEASE